MNSEKNPSVPHSIEQIFAQHQKALNNFQRQHKGKKRATKQQLELALTILLVELASADQNFDTDEYNRIVSGLKRIFGTDRTTVSSLISQANQALANLRGSSQYGELLKENLSLEQRQAVLEVVEEVIYADGHVDGFELYVRNKIAGLLGLPISHMNTKDEE